MTDSELPEFAGELIDETDADSRAPRVAPSVVPEAPTAAILSDAAPGFSSRREMREAGGYRSQEADAPSPGPRRTGGRRPALRRPAKRAPRTRDAVRSDAARPARTTWRRRLSSAGVMSVVFGMFAAFGIPAAFADQDLLAKDAGPLARQNLEILASTNADEEVGIRDTYGITNAADLRKMYADAMRQQNLASYMSSGAREMGDDYPWPDQLSRPQGGGLSPLNYYYRECVDFVAWRLNRDAGSTGAPFRYVWSNLAQGSAYSWKRAWESKGWPTGTTPEVGAVAWTPGGNHVAYVSGVLADGSVVIEEYNYARDHGYGQRIIPASSAYYLYAPPR